MNYLQRLNTRCVILTGGDIMKMLGITFAAGFIFCLLLKSL